ncbi:MAG: hypothetical protein NZ578_05115 [Candidatus Binatia bacterium]|nr:hypothetical protein [Candidatus Binatia bacterium]
MRIALDPWGSEYTGQLAVPVAADADDPLVQTLDEAVEERPWAPIVPCPSTMPAVTVVVDGVMRTDAHAVIIEEDRQLLALFCSYAVGAVTINRAGEVVAERVDRLFIVGGGQSGMDILVRAGSSPREPLCYRSLSSRASTPEQLREALATEMRQAEAAVAEQLSGPETLILADGNLTFLGGSSSVVGVIKTIQRMYLSPKRAAMLGQLAPGQRTPLFRIQGGVGRKATTYSPATYGSLHRDRSSIRSPAWCASRSKLLWECKKRSPCSTRPLSKYMPWPPARPKIRAHHKI